MPALLSVSIETIANIIRNPRRRFSGNGRHFGRKHEGRYTGGEMNTDIKTKTHKETGGEIVLCIAKRPTDHAMLHELAHLGCAVYLLTTDDLRDTGWPHEILHEFHTMPGDLTPEQIRNTVTYLARSRKFSRILPLDEKSIETAAALREHMRIPGMGLTTTRNFSDRLATLAKASHLGLHVPQFTSILNYDDLRVFMECVPAPWLLRPRHPAIDHGARTLHDAEQLWRALDELGDRQTDFLLEQSQTGEIFSVESIIADGKIVFAATQYHGKPGDGAVTVVRAISRTSREDSELKKLNATLILGLGLLRGISHARFFRTADGRFSLLDVIPGAGNSLVAEVFAHTCGIDLWAEWARLEVNALRGQPYVLPPTQNEYAGGILSLSATPAELASFNAPEVVHYLQTEQGTGLIVRAKDAATITRLLGEYRANLIRDFSL